MNIFMRTLLHVLSYHVYPVVFFLSEVRVKEGGDQQQEAPVLTQYGVAVVQF